MYLFLQFGTGVYFYGQPLEAHIMSCLNNYCCIRSQVNNNINSFINCVNTIILIILLYSLLCPVYLWKKKAWLPSCK